jgi:hypothetical protein
MALIDVMRCVIVFRFDRANLTGRVALVTGGRVKIGYGLACLIAWLRHHSTARGADDGWCQFMQVPVCVAAAALWRFGHRHHQVPD